MSRINLLPPEIVAGRKARREGALLAIGFGAVVLVLAGLWLMLHFQLNQQEERLSAAQAEAQSLQVQINSLQRFAILEQAIQSRVATLSGAMVNDVGWSRLLRDVSNIMPANSWLTSFNGSTQGVALAAPAAPAAPPAAGGAAPPGGAAVPPAATPAVSPAAIGTLTFSAVTFDFPGVAKWILTLEQLGSLQNIFVPSAAKEQRGGREVVNFTSTADLSPTAASGRYQMRRP